MSYLFEGICRVCGEKKERTKISRHLGTELKKVAIGNHRHFYLKVEAGPFFLHLLLEENLKLLELDGFLRQIWLECCGHLSEFIFKGEERAFSMDFEEQEQADKASKNRLLKEVFSKGLTGTFVYDFGSSSELELKVMGEYDLKTKQKDIIILSRNEPYDHRCTKCGKAAELVDIELIWEGPNCFFCEDCGLDGGEEGLLNISNSPRMGVCAYEEGEEQQEFVYKKKLQL